jgi:2',3'-cyclic-nucleotide 2'-phosphodiesterase (5'-nucleotidase family)
MPYANEIVLVELTGTELTQVLNRSVRGNREEEDGGFLQVSGIRFKIQDHKVHNIEVGKNRKPLALKKQYTVAIIDFMATGGDGYDMFAEIPIVYTRLPLRELIVDTVRNMQTISAHVEGRIIR